MTEVKQKSKFAVLFKCEPNIQTLYGPYDDKDKARQDIFKSCHEFHDSKIKSSEFLNGTEVFEVFRKDGVSECSFYLFEMNKMQFN